MFGYLGPAVISLAVLAVGSMDVLAQGGAVGGNIGKRNTSVSGDTPPVQPSKRKTGQPKESKTRAASVGGQWKWHANCSDGHKWDGGFVLTQNPDGTIRSEFNLGHPGTGTGTVTGSKIMFTRDFSIVMTIKQVWTASLTANGDRMVGTVVNKAGVAGTCQFSANRS